MSAVMTDWLPRHRITVDEYHRMGELGFFAPDARVELIDGQVIDMAPIGSHHNAIVDRLNELFIRAVATRAIVRVQGSLAIDDFSETQPDLALLVRREDFYHSRRATASDALLIVEVCDTTWRYDRHVKVPLYAKCGIPEVWLVDEQRRELHFFSSSSREGYTEATSTGSPGVTPIRALPGIAVDLSGLLAF